MTINELISRLTDLKSEGLGDKDVVITAQDGCFDAHDVVKKDGYVEIIYS